ncbi:RNA 2',3'-cyclic phosphodiesterase [Patescibacteria group bacterium]|nr:RNA 2',3'-cyclic phosphodiesterase [Patescibacteria group bacterium]
MNDLKRVFLGIDLTADLKEKIEKLKRDYNLKQLPIKLVEAENSHIAVKFLEDLSENQIKEIAVLVKSITENFTFFKIKIDNELIFPSPSRARVLALKIISPELKKIAEEIIKTIDQLPFVNKEKRNYTPHITLGRIRNRLTENEIKKITNLQFNDETVVTSVELFESKLTGQGPVYTILESFKLAG